MLTHRNLVAQPPPRVVVLGARGFVAAGLVRLLGNERIECRPVGRAEVDLTAAAAAGKLSSILRAGDTVVVCSALTPESGRDRVTFLKNVAMIDNLCRCLTESRCAHIIYVSSDSVYSSRCPEINEETCCESSDLYALAHIVREKLLAEACQSANIPLAIVRPCAIYGPGDTHNSYGPNRFLRTALANAKITLFGDGEELRDHVHVDDVTRVILECVVRGSIGIINAVSGTAHTFREVANAVAAAVGRPVSIETAPRRVPIAHRRFDPSALFCAFPGFAPTPLEAGIRESLVERNGAELQLVSGGRAR